MAAESHRPVALKIKLQADSSVNGKCLKKYDPPTEQFSLETGGTHNEFIFICRLFNYASNTEIA